ncbi:DUF4189 domain-containing protein [Lysobacter sp. BMK333-48F3]|uniref:DUF4189 domain-containing protein n=1 Tax=Lysobacter sp. BMK333-48F3 TaxID=2867962 RepID=UPI001C8BA706|nr:DUF4189 domain-containing protein [Lysobacter sp. BMK333-48F3]MBX9403418.1 DUF4189 domain-containing protein [Lysobacter sp. BMK333-48F3]
MKARLCLVVLALAFWAGGAYAQCPAGIPSAGNPQCVPPNAPGWGHNSSSGEPARPEPVWKRTWGAIAADGVSAALGTASGIDSRESAEQIALMECSERGGKDCVLDVSYYDQCAVLVTGDKRYLVQTAVSIERATEVGMQKCNAKDTNCRVYYSNCTAPIRVQ